MYILWIECCTLFEQKRSRTSLLLLVHKFTFTSRSIIQYGHTQGGHARQKLSNARRMSFKKILSLVTKRLVLAGHKVVARKGIIKISGIYDKMLSSH